MKEKEKNAGQLNKNKANSHKTRIPNKSSIKVQL